MPDNESQDEPTYDLVVPFENHRSAPTAPADPVSPPSAPLTAQHRALQRWFADRITGTGGDWRERALCAQVDPEIFHPEKGGSPRPAKLICRMCPVQVECLETALANNEMFGIWGGLTAHERTAFRRGTARERTHCKNGHEYTPENTRISATGFRRCRTCDNRYQRDAVRRKRAGL